MAAWLLSRRGGLMALTGLSGCRSRFMGLGRLRLSMLQSMLLMLWVRVLGGGGMSSRLGSW